MIPDLSARWDPTVIMRRDEALAILLDALHATDIPFGVGVVDLISLACCMGTSSLTTAGCNGRRSLAARGLYVPASE